MNHFTRRSAERGRAVGRGVEDEEIGGFAGRDPAALNRHDPFAGEVGAFGILRDGDVFALACGSDAGAGDDDDGILHRIGSGLHDGGGADQDFEVGNLVACAASAERQKRRREKENFAHADIMKTHATGDAHRRDRGPAERWQVHLI